MAAITARPFLLTTIGKKYLMGITGLIWAGFVFGHMAGNMLMFISPDAYNAYGHAITSGGIIYLVEAVLLLALATHILMAILLTKENKRARPQAYAMQASCNKRPTVASRTMVIQGSLILFFIINHLMVFKYGTHYETTVNGVVMRDLHRLLIETFQSPGYVAWYVVALVLLGFHLSHGFGSVFQSLGLKNDTYEPLIKKASWIYAIVVAGGFLTQPLYMFFIAK